MTQITKEHRHSKRNPCPVCGGGENDPRGQSKRCTGFTSDDGAWCHCSREEHAGAIPQNGAGLFAHLMRGPCNCGQTHGDRPDDIEATYDYIDESGALLFQVVRKAGKQFRQRKPDGAGGWDWKTAGIRRVLYRLSELTAAETVYICEGEKDVDNARRWELVATCNPGGAEKWHFVAEMARGVLTGKKIIILPDKDKPGERHAEQVAAALHGFATSIKVVPLPGGKDFSDFQRAHSIEELRELCEQTAEWSPDDRKIKVAPAPAATPISDKGRYKEVWRRELLTKKVKNRSTGEEFEVTVACSANVVTILRKHPDWVDVIAYNQFSECIATTKPAPWHANDAPTNVVIGEWSDADTARCVAWFAREEGLSVSAIMVDQAILIVADAQLVHPIRNYLRSIKWDGVQRLPTLLSTYFGAEQTPYTQSIGVRWMISAVARVMRPGCQVDCTIIAEGAQGIGKSSGFRALVPDTSFYSETGVQIGVKDSYLALHGVWIYMLDELDSLKRAGEVTKVKNFMTSPKDRLRPPYGKRSRDYHRQCVFAGTTNEDEYLADRTGNRRFWPYRVVRAVDTAAIIKDRDQLWAEAVARFDSGEKWYADTPEIRALCENEQTERVSPDTWSQNIEAWLANPKRWEEPGIVNLNDGITSGEVLQHAIRKKTSETTKFDEMRASAILRELGLTKSKNKVTRPDGSKVRAWYLPTSHANGAGGHITLFGDELGF